MRETGLALNKLLDLFLVFLLITLFVGSAYSEHSEDETSIQNVWYEHETLYEGETQIVHFDLDYEGELDSDNFELDQQEIGEGFENAGIENIHQVPGDGDLSFQFDVSGEEPGSEVEVFWSLEYDGETEEFALTDSELFNLEETWDINVVDNFADGETYQKVKASGDLLEVDIELKGETLDSSDLSPGDFYIEILDEDNQVVDSFSFLERSGGEHLTLSLPENVFPELERGVYEFDVYVEKSGYDNKQIARFPVYNYIMFEGRILNSQGNPVEADFVLERDDSVWSSFSTGSSGLGDGEYKEPVLPGSYDITVGFEDDVELYVEDVVFEETDEGNEGGRIMYDRVPRRALDHVEGVDVVKAAGVLFGHGFETGVMRMGYNFGDVDREEAKIMRCEDWPMSSDRECNGEWELLDNQSAVEPRPTVPDVKYPVEPEKFGDSEFLMKAYALVGNTDLVLDADVEETRVPLGDQVNLEGQVTTPEGESVSNVDINVEISDGEELKSTGTTTTDSSGMFDIQLNAPEEEGVYDISISAEREPFTPVDVTETNTIDTYVERSIEIEGPDQQEFRVGRTTEVEYRIFNTGQEDLEDVRFRIRGLDTDWYDTGESTWDNLRAGSSVDAMLEVEVPEDYFDGENMENVNYDGEARAVSSEGEHNDLSSTVATITNEHLYSDSDSESSTSSVEDDMLELPSAPTGDFLEETSSLNIALGLIMMFTLVLATAIKKKKDEDDRGTREFNGSGRFSGIESSSGSSRVSSPNVSGKSSSVQNNAEDSGERSDQEKVKVVGGDDQKEESSGSPNKCSICGETFDTESAKKMHEKAIH